MSLFNTEHYKSKKIIFDIDVNGCFICISHKAKRYPSIHKNTKLITIARHIYEECFGEISKGKVLRHKCDNVKCINPEHLEIGTQADNNKDTRERGRFKSVRGEKRPGSILKENQVKKIRKDKRTAKEIAREYRISASQVGAIRRRLKWKWLED